MENRWKKIVAERAVDVVRAEDLADPSVALLTDDVAPADFVTALWEAGQLLDAARVLACALPRREAVWWACVCARGMDGVVRDPAQQLSLAAAEKWVYEPTDEHRTAAYVSVQKCREDSGGKFCALAAAFSEEVLPLGGDQKVEVENSLFPNLVFFIVMQAAGEGEEDLMDQRLQEYLAVGKDIACGGSGKKEALPA
jgi:hypothetical protein